MNLTSKVIIRVEYKKDDKTRICYGEIDEFTLENVHAGLENFMLMENDVIDTQSIMSIELLEVTVKFHMKLNRGSATQTQGART